MLYMYVYLTNKRTWRPSLGVGDSRVPSEGEVVVDVLIVGQPAVGPDQRVGAHRHLGNTQEEPL